MAVVLQAATRLRIMAGATAEDAGIVLTALKTVLGRRPKAGFGSAILNSPNSESVSWDGDNRFDEASFELHPAQGIMHLQLLWGSYGTAHSVEFRAASAEGFFQELKKVLIPIIKELRVEQRQYVHSPTEMWSDLNRTINLLVKLTKF